MIYTIGSFKVSVCSPPLVLSSVHVKAICCYVTITESYLVLADVSSLEVSRLEYNIQV